jgi:hypothetical protein
MDAQGFCKDIVNLLAEQVTLLVDGLNRHVALTLLRKSQA